RAADLVGDDAAAINAFKANPALAFTQLSRGVAAMGVGRKAPAGPRSAEPPGLGQIDGQLAAQLKRLGKSDANTKLRALAELKEYVDANSWESGLEGMLAAWPPQLRRHIFDPDRRVRLAMAQVNAALAVKAGRRLAGQLKQLIGPWVGSWFDPQREVGRSSRRAFESVFPEAKRAEALAFCVAELLEFASDNILNQTSETLSDPRTADEAERRSKYEHIAGASFGVVALVVEEVDDDRLRQHTSAIEAVLGTKKALAMLGSPAPFVRRSVYRLIRAVMLKDPQLAAPCIDSVGAALLKYAFADGDGSAHGDMWDALLLTTKNFTQVWERGGKAAAERLFEFLRKRSGLAPAVTYPSVLALVANLPASVVDEPWFATGLLDALWQGAAGTRASGTTGAVALATAASECQAYLWTRALRTGGDAALGGVEKAAMKEMDRLWHFYVQHVHRGAEAALAEPLVKLLCKIEAIAARYDDGLLDRIWAQTSWFALQRSSGDAASPVVDLIARIAHLDKQTHSALVEAGRKLLSAFAQVAVQTPDSAAACTLVDALVQCAPECVFDAENATEIIERVGQSGDAVALELARARYALKVDGAESAAYGIDQYAAKLIRSQGLEAAAKLLAELASGVSWAAQAQMPLTEAALLAAIDRQARDAATPKLVRVCGLALQLCFGIMSKMLSATGVERIIAWAEQVFMSGSPEAARAVLDAWAGLGGTGDFARRWLQRADGRPALIRLFDAAQAEDDALVDESLLAPARRAWAAVTARLSAQKQGAELAHALAAAVTYALDDLQAIQDPAHLAVLAAAVLEQVSPPESAPALCNAWLVNNSALELEPAEAAAACATGEAGLWCAASDVSGGSRGLARWHAAQGRTVSPPAYDTAGRSQFARHAEFAALLVQRLGGITKAMASIGEARQARFVVQLALAFVLLRDAVEVARGDWAAADATGCIVCPDAEAHVLAQADAAALAIQDVVSDYVGALDDNWLDSLVDSLTGTAGEPLWARLISECVQRAASDAAAPWPAVVGRLVLWRTWSQLPTPGAVEAGVGAALARALDQGRISTDTELALAASAARALRLRRLGTSAPAIRSALLAAVDHIERTGSLAAIELAAELLPLHSAALPAAPAAKMTRAVAALRTDDAATGVAALIAAGRLAECAAPAAGVAQALVALGQRWASRDEPAVLAAAGHLAEALSSRFDSDPDMDVESVRDGLSALGGRLVAASVVSERPEPSGAAGAAALAENGLAAAPDLAALVPVLATAGPHLAAAAVRLAGARNDVDTDAIVRLVQGAARRMGALHIPPEEIVAAADTDTLVHAASVRLLAALHVMAAGGRRLQSGDRARFEDLSEQLAQNDVLSAALPWVCGLLGLASTSERPFNARLWDSISFDWRQWSEEPDLGVLALHVLISMAAVFPATLRSWWAALPQAQRQMSQRVEAFVTRFVAPELAHAELDRVRAPEGALAQVLSEHDDAGARAGSSSATLTYVVDDATVELAVRLAPNYPLTAPAAEAVRRVAVTEARWRAWAVAATAQLARNCRIDWACAQLLGNVAAHFDGVEDCAICYSAVSALDSTLPTKQCRTCKNRFHRMCLFKWFTSSNQSTCPLCRNLF
ncbi:hypothetical protein GGF46_005517, partial [Coemansia sp. RSA 552]